MKTTLVTSSRGLALIERRVAPDALARFARVLVQSPNASLDPVVAAILNAWDVQRHRWGQATRRNNPHGFGRGMILNGQDAAQNCALVIEDDAEIRAVISGVIETRRMRYRLGVVHIPLFKLTEFTVDFTAFISDGKPETLQAARRCLAEFVNLGAVDAVQLRYVEADSEWRRVIEDRRETGLRYFEVPSTRWVAQILDPVTGQRIEHGSSKTRSTNRRKDKQLENHFQGRVEIKPVTTRADVDAFIPVVGEIFRQTWHAAFGPGIHDGLRDYFYELADDGVLRPYVLWADGKAIAYVMGDLYGGTYYLWDTAYLPEYAKLSAGTYLFRRVFEDLAAIGATRFDFGWGDFDYKKVLGGRQVEDRDIHLYAPRLLSAVACAVGGAISRTEIRLKHLAKSYDLKNAVHRYWRKAKALLSRTNVGVPAH